MNTLKSLRIGKQTIRFLSKPSVIASASVVGPKEGRGPLADKFDVVLKDAINNADSYETAEHTMLLQACEYCIKKADMKKEQIDLMLGGDLLNQILSTTLTARELQRPFLGLYGACSTMAESLALGSLIVDGGYADHVLCCASSHYCTAERQFRYPLEYGNQRTPAAQWTVTGAGAFLLGRKDASSVCVSAATIGRIVDYQIKDANNMGAAMAPAAADTLATHFLDTGRTPADYDYIFSGDLGKVGSDLLKNLMKQKGFAFSDNDRYTDCGLMIFDPSDDIHAGASGCGCSSVVLSAYILDKIRSGEWKRVLFMATGALMSTTSSQQGESIPGIAHAIVLEHQGGC